MSVASERLSSIGPTFDSRSLGDGVSGDHVGSVVQFLATVTATYNGPSDFSTIEFTMNITNLSVWAVGHPAYGAGTNVWFSETTPGNTGSSDRLLNLTVTSSIEVAANYQQLVWDATDVTPLGAYTVNGTTITRTFIVNTTGGPGIYTGLDGFEIYGDLSFYFIPEPSVVCLLGMGSALIWVWRRRQRPT